MLEFWSYWPLCAFHSWIGLLTAELMNYMQYNDNVVGPGSPKYDDAYFEINYVRAYTTGAPAPTPSPSSVWVYPNGSSKAVTLPAPTGVYSGPTSSIETSPNATGRRMDFGRLVSLVGFALLGVTLM